jgi:hypothetical protein
MPARKEVIMTEMPPGLLTGSSRPEDRNARQVFRNFGDGATLAELEAFIADMRRRGASDDAHPEVTVNGRNEVTGITCVTERFPSSDP